MILEINSEEFKRIYANKNIDIYKHRKSGMYAATLHDDNTILEVDDDMDELRFKAECYIY